MLSKNFLAIVAAALAVQASPVEKRNVVPHDSITPYAEKVPNTRTGNSFKRFEPLLHIAHGCQSYPAVDDKGNVSGGLQDTGSSSGGCRDTHKGQTYVRGGWYKGHYGIMYAWYFPKDMPTSGVSAGAHRHDWENVVIWVNNPAASDPLIQGGAASGHGNYKKTTEPDRVGERAKVEYFTHFPYNHELQFTQTEGRDLAMIAWESMSAEARNALNTHDFGKAIVPFKDSTFNNNLQKAFLW